VAAPHIEEASLLPAAYTDPVGSLRLLRELVALSPDRADLLLASAREGTALGVIDTTREARLAHLHEAISAARAAVALEPGDADAHYWLAASLGLAADVEGGRTKITLAREAYAEALRTLELDSVHGGAHHVVGRMHTGSLRLSWISRLVARGLGLGEILGQASWESADLHLRRAVALDPDPLVHHVELAKLLLERGDEEEAVDILEAVAERSPRHDLDAHYIEEARELLSAR
jgi:tetratricopeptide (TPR) repeat protein